MQPTDPYRRNPDARRTPMYPPPPGTREPVGSPDPVAGGSFTVHDSPEGASMGRLPPPQSFGAISTPPAAARPSYQVIPPTGTGSYPPQGYAHPGAADVPTAAVRPPIATMGGRPGLPYQSQAVTQQLPVSPAGSGPPTPGSYGGAVQTPPRQPSGEPISPSGMQQYGRQRVQPAYQQSGPKINPAQMPSPKEYMTPLGEEPRLRSTAYASSAPPPSWVWCNYVDNGSCSPKFMRSTFYRIPTGDDLVKLSNIPVSVVFQPFAEQEQSERPVQLVDFGKDGPLRCLRCRAYVNPGFKFYNAGRTFVCNLCGVSGDVPHDYVCNTDANGVRRDAAERPELNCGVVDFVAPESYTSNQKGSTQIPPGFMFLLDVSATGVASGVFTSMLTMLNSILPSLVQQKTRVGIMTCDNEIHFYNLLTKLSTPQVYVCADFEEPYIPHPKGIIVDASEAEDNIRLLLETLPLMYPAEARPAASCWGAALRSAVHAVKECGGGKVLSFQTILPEIGPGRLKEREFRSPEKERALMTRQDSFYWNTGVSAAKSGVSVDLFLFPRQFMDMATIGCLPGLCGGQMNVYPMFSGKDTTRVIRDVFRVVYRETAFDCIGRIRCGAGMHIDQVTINSFVKQSNEGEMSFSSWDADKAMVISLKHDEKLKDKSDFVIQAAMIYSTRTGQRLLRVHTLTLQTTDTLGNAFAFVDLDATLSALMRKSLGMVSSSAPVDMRNRLTDHCISILSTYRKCCSSAASSGQLILPESLKLLPLFGLGLTKTLPFQTVIRGVDQQNVSLRIDQKAHLIQQMMTMGCQLFMRHVYPHFFALHRMDSKCGTLGPREMVPILPPILSCSASELTSDGVFLLDCGGTIFVWCGESISAEECEMLFGVPQLANVDTDQLVLVSRDNPFSRAVVAIIDRLSSMRPFTPSVRIVRRGMQNEFEFLRCLVEDKDQEGASYVDHLCHVHRQVLSRLT